MYKVTIEYKPFLGDKAQMYLGIQLYHPEHDKNGVHIASSCVVGVNLLKGISQKRINALLQSLVPALEACMEEIDRRKNEDKL